MLSALEIISAVRTDLADTSATRWKNTQIIALLNECLEEINLICHINRREFRGHISNGDTYLEKPADLELIDTIYIRDTKIDTISQDEATEKDIRWQRAIGKLKYVVDDYMPEYGLRLFPIPNDIIEPTILDGVELEISDVVNTFGLCLDKIYPTNDPVYGFTSINNSLVLDDNSCIDLLDQNNNLVTCETFSNSYAGVITDIKDFESCAIYGILSVVESETVNTASGFGAVTGALEDNYSLFYISKFPKIEETDNIEIDKKYKQGIVFFICSRLLENDSAYQDLRLSEIKYKKYIAEIAKYKKLKRDKFTTNKKTSNLLYRGFQ